MGGGMSRGNDMRAGHEGGDDGSDTPLEKSALTKRNLNGWKGLSNGVSTSRRKEEGWRKKRDRRKVEKRKKC